MVFAGRGLGKAGFGEFSLVYNVLLFDNMIQVSLISQPHNVLGTGPLRRAYALSRLCRQHRRLAGFHGPPAERLIAGLSVVIARRGWHCWPLLMAAWCLRLRRGSSRNSSAGSSIPKVARRRHFSTMLSATAGRPRGSWSSGGWIVACPPAYHHRLNGPSALYPMLAAFRRRRLHRPGSNPSKPARAFTSGRLGGKLALWKVAGRLRTAHLFLIPPRCI